MSHLDICSTSYGKKKGQKSNCQFDSQSLKVRNRPNPDVCKWSATHVGKPSRRDTSCFRLHLNQRFEQRVMNSQSPESSNRDSFGTPPWESQDKKPFECRCRKVTQRILYGERWCLPPNPSHRESYKSIVAHGLS
jgi:hypothetical protein